MNNNELLNIIIKNNLVYQLKDVNFQMSSKFRFFYLVSVSSLAPVGVDRTKILLY